MYEVNEINTNFDKRNKVSVVVICKCTHLNNVLYISVGKNIFGTGIKPRPGINRILNQDSS